MNPVRRSARLWRTNLKDLPEELLAEIYQKLPDSASKEAFVCSTPLVSNAPSVMHRITKLKFPLQQDHCSFSFPRAAHLTELAFRGHGRDVLSDGCGRDDGQLLLRLLCHPQDPHMRDKLQQVQSFKLYDCVINPDREAQLGAFLRSLPHLQALTIDDYLLPSGHARLLTSLSVPFANGALKKLHCTMFDAPSVRAVARLKSLESLSWDFMDENDLTPNIVEPLTALTALRHLALGHLEKRDDDGSEVLLPKLCHLTSLRLVFPRSSSQLAAMPSCLRRLELECPNAAGLLSDLEFIVHGAGLVLPSLCHLHLDTLDLFNFIHSKQPDSPSELREIGLSVASCLAALPSLSLTIDHVWSVSRLSPFLAFFEALPQFPQSLASLIFDDDFDFAPSRKIAPSTLAHLANLCPNLQELAPEGSITLEDMELCLEEVKGFPKLSRFDVVVDIEGEPHYESLLINFCAALAVDQNRCRTVSLLKIYVFIQAGGDGSDSDEELNEHLGACAGSLERAWEQVYTSLPGKVREVSLEAKRYSFDS